MGNFITRPSDENHNIEPGSDYINNLPNCVLSRILSCLPAKDVVRTCILSKEWRFKWTLIYNLNIDRDELSFKWRNEANFVNVVERVLHSVENVNSFRLLCYCRGDHELRRIAMLISDALRREIKSLELEIKGNKKSVLSINPFNCPSLRKLMLKFKAPCMFLRVYADKCSSNLKHSSLEKVVILKQSSDADTLMFTFPVLKKLELIECKWPMVKFVEFHAPSLCTFESRTGHEWPLFANETNYSIKIIGAKITELRTGEGYPENIIMIDSRVALARIRFSCEELIPLKRALRVRNLLGQISHLMELSTRDGLPAIIQKQPELPLPTLFQLARLHLIGVYHIEGMINLLHAAPLLKFLEMTDLVGEEDPYDFNSVENVPSCVVHHLEKVTFDYTFSECPNYRVEKFLLEKGEQLKTVLIKVHPIHSLLPEIAVNKMFEKFSNFTKASACLEIVVLGLDKH